MDKDKIEEFIDNINNKEFSKYNLSNFTYDESTYLGDDSDEYQYIVKISDDYIGEFIIRVEKRVYKRLRLETFSAKEVKIDYKLYIGKYNALDISDNVSNNTIIQLLEYLDLLRKNKLNNIIDNNIVEINGIKYKKIDK